MVRQCILEKMEIITWFSYSQMCSFKAAGLSGRKKTGASRKVQGICCLQPAGVEPGLGLKLP